MGQATITSDMTVFKTIKKYPEAADVFCKKYGCPDMTKGFFAFMARIMKIRWAAKVHKIPLDNLMRDLNAVAKLD